jgi:hypothetical protein
MKITSLAIRYTHHGSACQMLVIGGSAAGCRCESYVRGIGWCLDTEPPSEEECLELLVDARRRLNGQISMESLAKMASEPEGGAT